MKKINMYLPEPQIKRLKKLSKKLDMSYSEIIRRAIDAILDEHENTGDVKNGS